MIPLNKPGYISAKYDTDYLSTHFSDSYCAILSTAGDGLNLIYQALFHEHGPLKVGVSPLACFQAIYPIVAAGHTPVFIDVDKYTLNIDVDRLTNTDGLDAVELIHLGGNPNVMDKISAWAKQKGIIVVEDCAQALGSTFDGIVTGTFGDYAVYSLIKNLNAHIGGLLVSKEKLATESLPQVSPLLIAYKRIKKYLECHCNHHTYNLWNLPYFILLKLKERNVQGMGSKAYRTNEDIEERLKNEMTAINLLNTKRIANATYIMSNIDNKKYQAQREPERGCSNRNRLIFRLAEPVAEKTIAGLRQAGIAANNLTQNYLRGFQPHVSKDSILSAYYQSAQLPCYDDIFAHVMAVPCSPFLRRQEVDYIINNLNSIS